MLSSLLNRIAEVFLFRFEKAKTAIRSWHWATTIRRQGGEVGDGLCLLEGAQFNLGTNCKINIGREVTLGEGARVYVGPGAKLSIGSKVYIGRGTTLAANESVQIGEGSQIAHCVTLIDTDHRFDETTRSLADQGEVTAPISIGKEVWIGASAILLKNVQVGDRAVIGAGAVVTKNVPPATTVVGNPARPL